MKYEVEQLKERINTYKKILSRWDKVAKLFEDKVRYGESWSEKTYDLVKDLINKYDMLIKRYDLLDEDWVRLKKEYLLFQQELDKYKLVATTCPKMDCEFYSVLIKCLKGHKSCCKLLYISDDYQQKFISKK